MSKGGGSGSSTTTVQKADPWSGLQGPLSALYSGALGNFKSGGPQYYPGQTVAGTNGAIQQAEQQGTQIASQPSAIMQGANNTLTNTINGTPGMTNPAAAGLGWFSSGGMQGQNPAQQYFQNSTNGQYTSNQNPFLSGMFNAAAAPVMQDFQQSIAPGIASQFSLAGRTGSGAHQAAFDNASQTLGRTLGNMGSSLYGTAYENERNRQQAAAGQLQQQGQFDQSNMLRSLEDQTGQYAADRGLQQAAALGAPQFDASKYNDLNKLMGIGQLQQSQEQQYLDANKARYDYGQQLPTLNLQTLNQLLQGGSAYNSQSTTGQNQLKANPFASGMGGAFMGNVLGPMLGLSGGAGALGGGLLGALFG